MRKCVYNKNVKKTLQEVKMKKEEILQKAQEKKDIVGEMEKAKINKSCWIGNICACAVAVAFMIIEGILGHYTSIYALASVCFIWASVFYFCQYFIAKRPVGVLIGAILEAIGAAIMITFFILFSVGVF